MKYHIIDWVVAILLGAISATAVTGAILLIFSVGLYATGFGDVTVPNWAPWVVEAVWFGLAIVTTRIIAKRSGMIE